MRLVALAGAAVLAFGLGCGAASDMEPVPLPDGLEPSDEVGGVDGEGRFAVRLDRPARIGDRGRIRVEVEEVRTTARPGAEGQAVHTHLVVEGVAEVLDLDDRKRVRRTSLDLSRLDADFGGAEPAVRLDRGRIVLERAVEEQSAAVSLDGRAASASVRKALDGTLSLSLTSAPSDDQVFGTSLRQPVGARWPIQAELARRSMKELGISMPEGAVSGEMRLASVDRHAPTGLECGVVVGKLEMGPFDVKEDGASRAATDGRVTVRMRMVVPTALEQPRVEQETTTEMDMAVADPDGGLVKVTLRRAVHSAYAPIVERVAL
jgi:hypothetical protein